MIKNSISFKLTGKYALFTDPITKIGGEKFSYHLPTYEAIKGVLKSIYWKPTLIWHVDKVRVMKPLRTQTKGTKPLQFHGIYPSKKDPSKKKQPSFHDLAIYTFLHDVEYEVLAHFEWNEHRPGLAKDRIDGKHYNILNRTLKNGGRQDIFLGTRDCQGYVEPCEFGIKTGAYDDIEELAFGLMFHSFAYPDETGVEELHSRFWPATLKHGILEFPHTKQFPCAEKGLVTRFVRPMSMKEFGIGTNLLSVEEEEALL